MTNIYHIARHTCDNSIYVLFQGCNFRCKGCIRKQTIWYTHLAENVQRDLQAIRDFGLLPLGEFKTIIKRLNAKSATLGRGEPTLDEELPDIIDLLNGLDIKTHLLTNAHILNEKLIEKLEEVGLSSTLISIKAYDDDIHKFYTRQTNKSVLDNFKLLNKSRVKLMAESTLIPGLIGLDEIEKVAKFIASVNPLIPYRIDGFIPIHDAPWRSPSPMEVIRAAQIAKGHLKNVHYSHSEMEQKGQAINVCPTTNYDKHFQQVGGR